MVFAPSTGLGDGEDLGDVSRIDVLAPRQAHGPQQPYADIPMCMQTIHQHYRFTRYA